MAPITHQHWFKMIVQSCFWLDLLSRGAGPFGVVFAVTFMPRTLLILCLCSNTFAGCSASVCLHAGCCMGAVCAADSVSGDEWQGIVDQYHLSAFVWLSVCLCAYHCAHLLYCVSICLPACRLWVNKDVFNIFIKSIIHWVIWFIHDMTIHLINTNINCWKVFEDCFLEDW